MGGFANDEVGRMGRMGVRGVMMTGHPSFVPVPELQISIECFRASNHFFSHRKTMLIIDDDHIADRQLSAPSGFQFTIDGDIPFLDRDFSLPASSDQSCDFQELIQRNRRLVLIRSCHNVSFKQICENDPCSCDSTGRLFARHCFLPISCRLSYAGVTPLPTPRLVLTEEFSCLTPIANRKCST